MADLQDQIDTLRADLEAANEAMTSAQSSADAASDEAAAALAKAEQLEATCVTTDGLGDLATSEELAAETAAREAGDAALQAQVDDIGLAYTPIVYYTALQAQVDDLELISGAADLELATMIADEADTREATDAALDARLTAVELDYLTSASLAGYATESWVAAAYVTTTAMTDADAALEAEIAGLSTGLDDLSTDVTDLAAATPALIDSDTTIDVPADYATLPDALAALEGTTIAPGATVTILLASGTYTHSSTLKIVHPQGDRIEILGDGLGAELYFTGCDGIDIGRGNALGYMDNVVINGDDTTNTRGVIVGNNGYLELGPSVTVSNFYAGVAATGGGVILAGSVTSDSNTAYGFLADYGGFIYAYGAEATDNPNKGFVARLGGGIDARYATSDVGTGYYGYAAMELGWIDAQASVASGQTSIAAYWASDLGMVMADNATVTGTNGYGYSYAGVDGGFLSIQAADASSGSPCYAHSESILHMNGSTVCLEETPDGVYEAYGTSNPSGAILSW